MYCKKENAQAMLMVFKITCLSACFELNHSGVLVSTKAMVYTKLCAKDYFIEINRYSLDSLGKEGF